MKDCLIELLDRVRTSEERAEFLVKLSRLQEGLYMSGERANSLKSSLPVWLQRIWSESADLQGLDKMVAQLKQVSEWPVLGIVIVSEPDENVVAKASAWARKNVDKRCVIEFKIDRSLGLGARIEYRGKLKDYSVKNNLDKYGI